MNTINKKLVRNAFGIALGLCVAAVPGYSATDSTFLTFTGGAPAGGNVNLINMNSAESLPSVATGTTGYSMFSAPFDATLAITGTGPDQADNGTWTLTSSLTITADSGGVYTFSLNGTIGACTVGTCSGGGGDLSGFTGVLETFNATPTITGGYAVLNIALGSFASTSISDLLESKLGYATGATDTETGGSIKAGAPTADNTTNGTATFAPNSDTLNASISGSPAPAVPEPMSFLLLGSGLLGVALVARRRAVKI